MIDMLIKPSFFHRIFDYKLQEDLSACLSSLMLYISNHKFLNWLHQIVKVRTLELSVQYRAQTLEHTRLGTEIIHICFDNKHKSFDLEIWKIWIHAVSPYKFWSTFEQTVQKLWVWITCTVKKLENPV
jgi:hypothetical protein